MGATTNLSAGTKLFFGTLIFATVALCVGVVWLAISGDDEEQTAVVSREDYDAARVAADAGEAAVRFAADSYDEAAAHAAVEVADSPTAQVAWASEAGAGVADDAAVMADDVASTGWSARGWGVADDVAVDAGTARFAAGSVDDALVGGAVAGSAADDVARGVGAGAGVVDDIARGVAGGGAKLIGGIVAAVAVLFGWIFKRD